MGLHESQSRAHASTLVPGAARRSLAGQEFCASEEFTNVRIIVLRRPNGKTGSGSVIKKTIA